MSFEKPKKGFCKNFTIFLTNKGMDGHSEQFNEKNVVFGPAKWHFPFSATTTRKNDTKTDAKSRRNSLKKQTSKKKRKQVIYSDFTDSRTHKVSILYLFMFLFWLVKVRNRLTFYIWKTELWMIHHCECQHKPQRYYDIP